MCLIIGIPSNHMILKDERVTVYLGKNICFFPGNPGLYYYVIKAFADCRISKVQCTLHSTLAWLNSISHILSSKFTGTSLPLLFK